MFGASLLKLIKMKIAFSLATASVLIVGMIAAFIVSVFAIRFLNGVYPQARLQGVRRVSDRLGNFGIRLLFLHEVRVQ